MNRSALFLALASLAAAVAGCRGLHDERNGPELVRRAGGAEHVRNAASELSSYASEKEALVPAGAWPEVFRRIGPQSISVDKQGVYVSMRVDTMHSSSLYVPFQVNRPVSCAL